MEPSSLEPRRPWLAGILSYLSGRWGRFVADCDGASVFGFSALPSRFSRLLPSACRSDVTASCCFACAPWVSSLSRCRYVPVGQTKSLATAETLPTVVGLRACRCRLLHDKYRRLLFDRSFVADAFLMPTRKHVSAIQPGDRFLVDKLWFSRNRINRGDVVVYRSSGPGSPLLAKRVAGLPGDEIEMRTNVCSSMERSGTIPTPY